MWQGRGNKDIPGTLKLLDDEMEWLLVGVVLGGEKPLGC